MSDSSDVEENEALVGPEDEDLLEQITLEWFGGSTDCGVSDEER